LQRLHVPLLPRREKRFFLRPRLGCTLDLHERFCRLTGFERQSRERGLLDQIHHCRRIPVVGCREQPRGRSNGDPHVRHLRRARRVGRVEVGVVVAIGEVPVEQRRDARGEKDRVIASSFVRVRLHHPTRIARPPEADGQVQVVQEISLQRFGRHATRSPFGVRIRRAQPDCRRIRLFLDEERASRLRDVLAGHVQREGIADGSGAGRIRCQPLTALADLITPEKRQRARRRRDRASSGGGRQAARNLEQRRATARVVVRPGFLHVGDEHDALVRPSATGDFGNQRPVGTRMEPRRDVHLQHHRAGCQAFLQARRQAPGNLEAERVQRFVVRDATPLDEVRRVVRFRVTGRRR